MKQRKSFHTPRSSKGMGDHYGTGIKQKVGRIRSIFPVDGFDQPGKNKGQSPKSLA